ncbi:MAG TPA: hypothetical protein VEA69_17375 [Tepidisphaeraceae bacterium]|nr:hypothetical protein [Tepidisphaeraceae bacterium]
MRTNDRSNGRNRGTTWADVVAVVAMLGMIGGVTLQAASRSRETAGRVKCGSNLRMLGQALFMYANENKNAFPRTRYTPDAALTAYTGEAATDPFGNGSGTPPDVNDTTAPLFLLVRTQELTADMVICPATGYVRDDYGGGTNAAHNRSNFKSTRNTLGYSYANPYPSAAAVQKGYKMNFTLGAQFAITADMNPGGAALTSLTLSSPASAMQKGNTRNHGGDGQNVGFADGHVEWLTTPFVGVRKDNIYTVSSGMVDGGTSAVIEGSPSWAGDSVLLPVMTVDPGVASASGPFGPAVLIVGGVVLLAVVGVILFFVMRKKPQPAGAGAYDPGAYAPPQTPGGYAPPPPQLQQPGAAPRRPGPPPLPPQQ